MALVKGTNCGFVTVAPTANPSGSASTNDNYVIGLKDVAPVGATIVTEIGWWCDNATEESNFEVGIYDHNATDNNPENLLAGASQTNAKGTTAEWKRVTGLNISITAESIYWIAVQLDNTATATSTDAALVTGEKYDYIGNATTLPNPFGTSGGTSEKLIAFYAVYTTGVELITPVDEERGTFRGAFRGAFLGV